MLNNYVVIDLEMTGLNPRADKIIEIGAARIRDGKLKESFETFVDPGMHIPAKAVEITGITDEMVKGAPTQRDAVEKCIAFCGEEILVGHNIIYDYSFLKQVAINEKIPYEKEAVDTLKIARKCLPELEHRTLEFLCEYYHISRDNGHRALCDCISTSELLRCLERDFYQIYPESFQSRPLIYKAKRQTPATKVQKMHLKELMDYHKISLDADFNQLTRSEASRLTDQIISRYGRIIRS